MKVLSHSPQVAVEVRRGLVRLPRSRWSLWACLCLRGAGFPADRVLPLSSEPSARLALRFVDERKKRRAQCASARLAGSVASTRAALADTLASETRRIRVALRAVTRDPAFRAAVLWQNRGALTHAIGRLASTPVDDVDSVTRKHELLVASYLQRYCVKNDTIGFFGPVGWARLSAGSPAIAVTCGPALVSAREVYFESWCIDALARALDADPGTRPWRVPCIAPSVGVDGTSLMISGRRACELSAAHLHVLTACDGRRHAKAIAQELRETYAAAFTSDESTFELLDAWRSAGYITWSVEGPIELHPERTLRARLEAIDDPLVRARTLAQLDALEAPVRVLRDAADDLDACDRALNELEATFTRLTGLAPTRSEGQMYAARTLVRHDCRRDADVALGEELVARLRSPLALVLQSARWAVHELTRRHGSEFREVFERLAGPDQRPVRLGAFIGPLSFLRSRPGTLSALGAAVRADLQQRWACLLAIPSATRRIQYRSGGLETGVRAAFDTPDRPPSSWTRYLSPDVMIDAPSVDAIRRGDGQLVLGEIHVLNTVLQSLFVDHHPDPAALAERLALDWPEPRVVWIGSKDITPHRAQLALRPNDLAYVATRDPSPVSAARTLRIGDLVVADEAGSLVVRTRDGRRRFPCLEFFGSVMMRIDSALFSLLPPAAHQPRVTIDEVVVSREQWHMPAGEIVFAKCGDALDRYVECQRWARDAEMPQFIFVKMPGERKPTYVDLSSPVYVDQLAKAIRRAQRLDPAALVAITEMLPTPAGAWLPDAAGRRHTCELRMVAVDVS